MTLAELAVKLTANTAEFISGFSNAGVATKRFRADLSDHVQAIGGALDGVLSHFGAFGSVIGQTLDQASQSAGKAITAFGGLGGVAGTVVGAGAGVAAAIAAVELGAVALAVHTSESIAKLAELSQSTGVSVEALSGLGFAGKEVGIDLETTTRGLEKMSKAVFTAATAGPGAVNAFTRLHIAVRDTTGEIRPVTEIFSDLAGKFAAMPDGVTKTALAIQVFGRGGAALVPLLNQGSEGLKGFLDTAQALGIVIDQKTAAASQKFKEDLVSLEAAGQGVAIALTKELLPALDFLAGKLVDVFKSKDIQGDIGFIIRLISNIAKGAVAVGDTFFHVFEQIGILLEALGGSFLATFNAIGTGLEAIGKAGVGDFSGAKASLKAGLAGLTQVSETFLSASKKAWADNAAFIKGTFSTLPEVKAKPSRSLDADTAAAKDGLLERLKARIEGLNQEAAAWAKVASAGTEAEQFILEAQQKADAEFAKLKAEAGKSPAATAFVLKNEGTIKAAQEQIFFGESVKKTITELEKQKGKLEEQDKAAIELGAAYKLGGDAIRDALVKAQFAQQAAVVQDLVNKHTEAVKVFGEESVQAKILADGVRTATQDLNSMLQTGANLKVQNLSNVLSQEADEFARQKPLVDALGNAYLQGETSVRRARIELELLNYALKNNLDPTRDATLIAQKRDLLEQTDRQAYQGALAQEAAQFSLNAQYDTQITKLQRVKEILQQNGQSTLLIDARLHDAQDSLLHQWDEAAFKIGNFRDKFRGVMGELVIQGRAAGQAISQAFLGAIDGIETNLAKLLTGQKTNFKQVAQGLAEQVTKAEIQKGAGALAGKFGLNIPGLTGKPDGSSESLALWVKTVGAAGTPSVGSVGNLFSSFRSGSDSGGGFSNFLSSFGGFKAGGGDMSPGSWYVAGERGPEIVKGPGSVIPNHALGGRTTNITHNHNYPSAQSRDLFGRTQQQNQARQLRNSRMAYGF